MKGYKKYVIYAALFIVLIVLSIVITILKLYEYLILTAVFIFVLGVLFTREMLNSASGEETQYDKKVARIIKTYAPILVNTNAFPDLKDKSILPVSSFDDLVNAQAEIRNPIYYVRGKNSTAFYLLNDNIFLIFFIRLNDASKSDLEIEIEKVPSSDVFTVDNSYDKEQEVEEYEVEESEEKQKEPATEEEYEVDSDEPIISMSTDVDLFDDDEKEEEKVEEVEEL